MITIEQINNNLEAMAYNIEKIDGMRKMFSQCFEEEIDAKEMMKAIVADDRFQCVSHLKIDDILYELPEDDKEKHLRWRMSGCINYHQRKYEDGEETGSNS